MKVTDEEIISTWKAVQSPQKVSELLELNIRTVYNRGNAIEEKYGIKLPVAAKQSQFRTTSELDPDRNAVARETIKTGIVMVASDAHYWPGEPSTAHRAFVHFCQKLKPQIVVMNGDAFDGASISRHPSIGWEQKPNVQQEIEAVQDRLQEIEKASKGAKFYWPAGNHDLRFESRLAAVAPEYKGVYGIHLKDHMPRWKPCWLLEINQGTESHTVIRHREKSGVHADFNNTKDGGVTIVTGHDHILSVEPYIDYREVMRWGVRTGYLAAGPREPQFVHYLEGRRPRWVSGFAILYYHNGILTWPQVVRVVREGLVDYQGQLVNV